MSSRDTTDDEEIEIEMQRQHERRQEFVPRTTRYRGTRRRDEEENQGDFSVSRRAPGGSSIRATIETAAKHEEDDDDEKKMKSDCKQPKPPQGTNLRSSPAVDEDEITITREP